MAPHWPCDLYTTPALCLLPSLSFLFFPFSSPFPIFTFMFPFIIPHRLFLPSPLASYFHRSPSCFFPSLFLSSHTPLVLSSLFTPYFCLLFSFSLLSFLSLSMTLSLSPSSSPSLSLSVLLSYCVLSFLFICCKGQSSALLSETFIYQREE